MRTPSWARPRGRRQSYLQRGAIVAGACVVSLGLAACGQGSSSSAEKQVTIPKTHQAADKLSALGLGNPEPSQCKGHTYTVGVDYFSTTEPFSLAWLKGVKDAAAKTGCVKIFALSDNADASTALSNVQTFVQRKVDGVLLLQVIAAAQPGLMRVLNRAKIPVLSSAVPAPGGIFVAVPDYASGFEGGKALAEMFVQGHPKAKPYLIIGRFPDGGEGSIQRLKGVTEGIQSVIPGIPKNQILDIDTKADPVGTRDKALAVIGKIPSGAQILASSINDSTAYAIFQALKQRKRAGDAHIMGIGGVNPDDLRYVCNNDAYYGTVSHMPDRWGNYLVPGVMAMLQGKKLPPSLDIPYKVLTRQNMRETYPNAPC